MEKSASIKEIATALCKFQSEMGKVKKTETNPFFKNKYAPLPDILGSVMPTLTANGLSVCQFPSGEHQLTTLLMHTSGEWIQDTYSMKPSKDDPQGLGSVITYQRRYALGAVLGLNIDEDDDGNKCSTPEKSNGDKFTNTWIEPKNVKPVATELPWLTKKQLDQALYKIEHGETSVYQKTLDAFRMSPEYKQQLTDMYNFSQNLA